jgi:membrane-associated phospholipid phosphatase
MRRGAHPIRTMATRPHSLAPHALAIAGWVAFAVAGATFFALAWDVASRAPLVLLDARVASWLHAHHVPALTSFMLFVTHANSTVAVFAYTAAFAVALYRMGERYWILTLALVMGGGMTLNVMLKHAYERARPVFEDPLITLASYSFPSGHTAGATLFYGVLAAFLVTRFFDRGIRALCVAVAIAAVLLVGFSRMYLGAHFLSDVLAATCSSIAWLVLCLSSVHALVRRRMAAGAA